MDYQDRIGLLARYGPVRYAYQLADYGLWRVRGSGRTPGHEKAKRLAKAVTDTRRTFIETGTYRGDMLARLMGIYDRLYSIERDPEYYRAAVRRFHKAPHVKVCHGDSAVALSRILAEVSGPCVVWLDAHPTPGEPGEVPLLAELRAVLAHPSGGHRVVIDDIRGFSGERGWPSLAQIVELLHRSGRVTHLSVECDMMVFEVEPGEASRKEVR